MTDILNNIDYCWSNVDLRDSQFHFRQIGDISIWIKRQGKEIFVAYRHVNRNVPQSYIESLPSDISWVRRVCRGEIDTVKIRPVFPDIPILVKPESTFNLSKRAEIEIYVHIPLWVHIYALDEGEEVTILEAPSVVLSKTWFGDFFEGDICYWISSRAKTEVEPNRNGGHLAISPIHLHNQSNDDLTVAKLSLKVPNLTIFSDGEQLWSDQMEIDYRGENEVGEIRFSGQPPQRAPKATLITKPREAEKNIHPFKYFTSMININSLGLPLKIG